MTVFLNSRGASSQSAQRERLRRERTAAIPDLALEFEVQGEFFCIKTTLLQQRGVRHQAKFQISICC